LEEPSKISSSNLTAMGRAAAQQLRLPRDPSSLALSASRDGAPTALWAAVPGPHCPLSEKFPILSGQSSSAVWICLCQPYPDTIKPMEQGAVLLQNESSGPCSHTFIL